MVQFKNISLPLDSTLTTVILNLAPGIPTIPFEAFGGDRQLGWTLLLLIAIWGLPNTQQIISKLQVIKWPLFGKPNEAAWFAIGGASFWIILILIINETRGVSEFIYFNF